MNDFTALAIEAALVYPNLEASMTALGKVGAVNFFSIPLGLLTGDYLSTVILLFWQFGWHLTSRYS